MAIQGIGTDIVQLHRIAPLWRQYGERFAKRILAPAEFEEFLQKTNQIAFLAKRFAAKEAVAKALGTGFGEKLAFKDICVTHNLAGKPGIMLLGKATALCEPNVQIHLSISDERDLAMAFVIIENQG